jgi:predicted solute-binding protein
MPPLRIGIPDLLEIRPLAWSFLKGQHADRYRLAVYPFDRIPSLLQTGDLEVGFVSAIDLLRTPALRRVRDLGVALLPASRGLVLRARLPLAEIRTVDCSGAGRWAIDLARTALRSAAPEAEWTDERAADFEGRADAELLSGRSAYGVGDASPVAALWHRRTSAPLPLGGWAVAARVDVESCEFALKSSLRYGLSSLEVVASEAAADSGLGRADLEAYYRDGLSFVLDEGHQRGLDRLRRALEPPPRRRRRASSKSVAAAGGALVASPRRSEP